MSDASRIAVLDIYAQAQGFETLERYSKHDFSSLNSTYSQQTRCFVKLLFPITEGYVIQSDFLSRRMVDCEDVIEVKSFMKPGQFLEPIQIHDGQIPDSDFETHAIGALIVQCPSEKYVAKSAEIDKEITKRLSFPWLSDQPILGRRLAIIGPTLLTDLRNLSLFEDVAKTAHSLNISIVMFGDEFH